MNTKQTHTALLFAALIAASFSAVAAETNKPAVEAKAAAKPMDLFANEVVAQGKGVKVTRSQLDEQVINLKAAAVARGQMIPPERMKMIEQQVLGRLIGMQILNGVAIEADRTNGQASAIKRFDLIKENAGSDENFTRQLKTVGMTEAELRKKLTEEAIADAVLEREITFEVTDADVKKFYDENPAEFEQPERVHAAHVLIGTRGENGEEMSADKKKEKLKLAEDILKRARAGEDFGQLAKEYSDDPGSKNKGGEYTFPRGQMVPEFEATAFGLEPGKISDVVTTQFGYHIIKLIEKLPSSKVELAKAEPQIKQFLKTRGVQKLIPPYMDKLEKAANVEILDADLKPKEEAAEPASAPKADEKK
jgi:peptidyl-prolyl cis-trans isomerase C